MNIVYTNAIGQDNPHLFPGMKKVFSELGITECADGILKDGLLLTHRHI